MEKKYKPVHIIHLLLYTPDVTGEEAIPIIGRTRLMKMVFLFQKELSDFFEGLVDQDSFDFEAYNYGPFSKKVYEALNFLETRNIIKTDNVSSGQVNIDEINIDSFLSKTENQEILYINEGEEENIYYTEVFSLTESGIKMMRSGQKWFSWVNLKEEKQNKLIQFKTKMINSSLTNILKYVYSKYPKYAEKSSINHIVFPNSNF
mgnify:CR=1 FL=1